MPVSLSIGLIGDPEQRQRVQAVVAELLEDRPEKWHVEIVGSQITSRWQMTVDGPNNSKWVESVFGDEDLSAGGRVRVLQNLLERVLRQYDE